MAQIDLYIDIADGALVTSATDSSAAELPPLIQGDTLNLRVYLLARAAAFPLASPPYSVINNGDLSLQVVVGAKQAASDSLIATQYSWTADANSQYFYAGLSLNTAAVTSLLGSAQTATSWLEVKVIESAVPITVLQKQVTINAAVHKPGAELAVPAGETAISAETANATFLKRTVEGQIVIKSPDGSKSVALWVDNDGVFHADPLT